MIRPCGVRCPDWTPGRSCRCERLAAYEFMREQEKIARRNGSTIGLYQRDAVNANRKRYGPRRKHRV